MANSNFFKGIKGFAIKEQKSSRVSKNSKDFKGFLKGALEFKDVLRVSRMFQGFQGFQGFVAILTYVTSLELNSMIKHSFVELIVKTCEGKLVDDFQDHQISFNNVILISSMT